MGRSKEEPDFLRYAGVMDTVICPLGMKKPEETMADLILPRDSLMDESHSPITSKVGRPGVMDTSMRDMVPPKPSAKQDHKTKTEYLLFISDLLFLSIER
jgi:hypothetical protein